MEGMLVYASKFDPGSLSMELLARPKFVSAMIRQAIPSPTDASGHGVNRRQSAPASTQCPHMSRQISGILISAFSQLISAIDTSGRFLRSIEPEGMGLDLPEENWHAYHRQVERVAETHDTSWKTPPNDNSSGQSHNRVLTQFQCDSKKETRESQTNQGQDICSYLPPSAYKYCIISFKSIGGVTRDSFNQFDISIIIPEIRHAIGMPLVANLRPLLNVQFCLHRVSVDDLMGFCLHLTRWGDSGYSAFMFKCLPSSGTQAIGLQKPILGGELAENGSVSMHRSRLNSTIYNGFWTCQYRGTLGQPKANATSIKLPPKAPTI
ncbi:hypothetical protein DFH06DRAFT_1123355 [Mycena polygramma]|nr:hypothetical protein DFH06DRAFT_1123355 [Mycena polygramma]